MKKSTSWIVLLIVFILAGYIPAKGQLVLYEDFNYAPPTNIGGNAAGASNNNWTTHSGGTGLVIDVVNGNLSYAGLQAPSGYKIYSDGNVQTRDVNRAITWPGTVLYYSALVTIVDNTHLNTTGDYFLHFGATAGTSISIFGARLMAKNVNSGANFRFGILNTSGTAYSDWPADLTFGTTYLVVAKYDRSTTPPTATLWVNPVSLGGPEPAGGVVNNAGTGTFNTFASICIRNGTNTPKFEIDEIRVGGTFADVTPLGITTPATQATNITFSAISATGMTVSWTNGSGANRIVKMNTTNSFTDPVNGSNPTANTVYGGGEQVIYNGNGNSVGITGLNGGNTYWFRVYEFNGTGSSTLFNITTAAGNPNSQATSAWIAPTVNTNPATNVSYTTLTANGEVLTDGGFPVTARGFCYSTTANPTISDPHTTETGTIGVFSSNISALAPGVVYHIRAYASNANVTGYGADITATTLGNTAPVVLTSPVTNITHITATAGGNVTSDGGLAITARGVCWSTTANPTISGNHTTEPGTTGVFTSNITGLSPQTTYHTRAYATNSMGTTYGADVTFTTLCEPYAPATAFYASATNLNVGDSINFFDQTTYCPVSWNWSFVGGIPMTSTVQNPTNIHFNYPGTFHVCLTTTNAYGSTTHCEMDYIVVTGPPQPADVNLVITEIMYNSPESGADSLEFIELYNNGSNVANLENFTFSEGISYTFPNVNVNPGNYLIVAKNSAAMQNTFGVSSLEWTSGSLSNSGELIRIKDYNGFTVDSVVYDDVLPWDTLANGMGTSLELCDPNANNALPENWRHAVEFANINTAGDTIWASPGTGCKYPPVADFTASETSILEGQSVAFTDQSVGTVNSWEWTFEGGNPATSAVQAPPAVVYSTMGSYAVSLKVTNADGNNTKTRNDYILVGPTGVKNLNPEKDVIIYPNPSKGDFSVVYKKAGFTAGIYSVTGNLIAEKAATEGKASFNLNDVPKGIYFVKITEGNSQLTRKLIIQ